MAKHYRQSKKDRRDESRGMKRAMKKDRSYHDSDAMMLPREPSDHMEAEDTQMYHMGKSYYGPGYGHPANLPPYPDTKYYPKGYKAVHTEDYPDTIQEIDRGEMYDVDNLNRQPSRSMY